MYVTVLEKEQKGQKEASEMSSGGIRLMMMGDSAGLESSRHTQLPTPKSDLFAGTMALPPGSKDSCVSHGRALDTKPKG